MRTREMKQTYIRCSKGPALCQHSTYCLSNRQQDNPSFYLFGYWTDLFSYSRHKTVKVYRCSPGTVHPETFGNVLVFWQSENKHKMLSYHISSPCQCKPLGQLRKEAMEGKNHNSDDLEFNCKNAHFSGLKKTQVTSITWALTQSVTCF